jgi:hypothetical protein
MPAYALLGRGTARNADAEPFDRALELPRKHGLVIVRVSVRPLEDRVRDAIRLLKLVHYEKP